MVMEIACPYCDTPSFVYNDSDIEMFLCHGCQRNKRYDSIVNNSTSKSRNSIHKQVSINHSSILSDMQRITSLGDTHDSVQFLRYRGIPDKYHSMFLYTESLGALVNRYGYNLKDGQPKIIIPFYDEDNKLFAMQARALDNTEPKYITLLLDKNKTKIFGLERWDRDKETIVVEGPIDSLFLPNCLAMAGSDIAENKYLNTDMIICLDNEPRNAEVISKYSKFIDRGFKIVIWPDNVRSKDINDMILDKHNPHQIIKENIFQGLQAKIKLDSWKRV